MEAAYSKQLENAMGRRKENKKFLDRLKKMKPADLDLVTNQLHDAAFEHIDCLKCANCCATTGPLLLRKDIERLAAHFNMRPADFTLAYLRIDEDHDYVFKKMPCPFLGTDKYCSVYEDRPAACRDYPHTQQRKIIQKLSITYHNTMICPAVAEVVEGLKKHYGA
ncbi:MAG: YkgJ family cysteine cluster protein [Chitinophagales bacterium]|nr:YkgJ family cysteine cluster protein [Chitinophagales bacterium]